MVYGWGGANGGIIDLHSHDPSQPLGAWRETKSVRDIRMGRAMASCGQTLTFFGDWPMLGEGTVRLPVTLNSLSLVIFLQSPEQLRKMCLWLT